MTENTSMPPARIVLVPYPITPLAAIAYCIFRRAQVIPESPHVFYHWRSNSGSFENRFSSDAILCLVGRDLYERTIGVFKSLPADPHTSPLERILNFCNAPPKQHRESWRKLVRQILLCADGPGEVLRVMCDYFDELAHSKLNPFKDPLPEIPMGSAEKPELSIPQKISGERLYVLRPRYGSAGKGERAPIIGVEDLELQEGRAFLLPGNKIAVGVFGPPNVGKSSLITNLHLEVDAIVRSLKTHLGWEEFALRVGFVNLDLGTPTSEPIVRGFGHDREAVGEMKCPWTEEMVLRAIEIFQQAQEESDVLFVDLPGMMTGITERLAAPLDGGIVISSGKDKKAAAQWDHFLVRLGIERLARVASRVAKQGRGSVARFHREFARGVVVDMDRQTHPGDAFVAYLARFLLFYILPNIVERREAIRRKILKD